MLVKFHGDYLKRHNYEKGLDYKTRNDGQAGVGDSNDHA